MRRILLVLLLFAPALFAQKAPFACQSDLIADLSDTLLGDIYPHRLGVKSCSGESPFSLEGFGNFRRRDSSAQRSRYDNWFGGILGKINRPLTCDSYLNFFLGGSWGEINIQGESTFDTNSLFLGMAWEHIHNNCFFGVAIAGGYLSQDRHYNDVHEDPQGVFLTPELTYAYQFNYPCNGPIFTSTLRYAGYFPHDYQHRETLGTLYVKERSPQFITLRGELSSPFRTDCITLEPYLGIAGRFQFDGNHVEGKRVQTNERFSDGIDSIIGYGLLGLRATKQQGCLDICANLEASYETDESWRILGDLNLNYRY